MATRIQVRRDTEANWTSNNPVLASGELALSTDVAKIKIGDSSTAWSSLGYATVSEPAVQALVDAAIANIVDGAPDLLNTLNELASAVGDDANFITTIQSSVDSKVSKAGDTLTGDLTLAQDPTSSLHAATKQYVDAVQEASGPKFLAETAEKTADYTLVLDDVNKVVSMNKSGAATITIPTNASVAFPIGTVIGVYNQSADDVNVVGDSGVTLRNGGALAQYAEVSLRKRATDEWVLAGVVS